MADDPTQIANEALDQAGVAYTIGDIEEGTRPAQVALRRYRNCLRDLLRAAPWNFARKQANLTLLADRTGLTAGVTANVQGNHFYYEYSYPPDAVKLRWIPWQPMLNPVPAGNIVQPNPALGPINPPNPAAASLPGVANLPPLIRFRPARFLISSDPNFAGPPGADQAQGISPVAATVILTNVPQASAVYTALVVYPSQWDALFREALVAYLASEIALPLNADKKLGLELRKENQAIAKDKILTARAVDANEAAFTTVNLRVNWMDARNSGGIGLGMWGAGGGWGGDGALWGGWDGCCGADSVEGGQAY